VFGSAPYTGQSSSIKPSCSRTESFHRNGNPLKQNQRNLNVPDCLHQLLAQLAQELTSISVGWAVRLHRSLDIFTLWWESTVLDHRMRCCQLYCSACLARWSFQVRVSSGASHCHQIRHERFACMPRNQRQPTFVLILALIMLQIHCTVWVDTADRDVIKYGMAVNHPTVWRTSWTVLSYLDPWIHICCCLIGSTSVCYSVFNSLVRLSTRVYICDDYVSWIEDIWLSKKPDFWISWKHAKWLLQTVSVMFCSCMNPVITAMFAFLLLKKSFVRIFLCFANVMKFHCSTKFISSVWDCQVFCAYFHTCYDLLLVDYCRIAVVADCDPCCLSWTLCCSLSFCCKSSRDLHRLIAVRLRARQRILKPQNCEIIVTYFVWWLWLMYIIKY